MCRVLQLPCSCDRVINLALTGLKKFVAQGKELQAYISKLSDDGGHSWHSLRFLRGGGSGSVPGAGCVRPRLLALNGSLVLAGGRPNPLSRDVVVWLNAAGDGEPVSKEAVSRRFGGLLELYYVLRPFGADQGQKRV